VGIHHDEALLHLPEHLHQPDGLDAARGKYTFCCFADMLLSSHQYDEEFDAAVTETLKAPGS
jgi:hypothetical protein